MRLMEFRSGAGDGSAGLSSSFPTAIIMGRDFRQTAVLITLTTAPRPASAGARGPLWSAAVLSSGRTQWLSLEGAVCLLNVARTREPASSPSPPCSLRLYCSKEGTDWGWGGAAKLAWEANVSKLDPCCF